MPRMWARVQNRMKISYAIMAVPERGPLYVQKQLKQPAIHCVDTFPKAWRQRGRKGRYRGVNNNFIRAITINDGSDYRISLHEDMELCDHFEESVACIVEAFPDRVLLFYTPANSRIEVLQRKGLYACGTDVVWPPIFGIPKKIADEYIEWYQPEYAYRGGEDHNFELFLRERGYKAVQTLVSLGQHKGYAFSSVGNPATIKGRARYSHSYIKDRDIRAIDWKKAASQL